MADEAEEINRLADSIVTQREQQQQQALETRRRQEVFAQQQREAAERRALKEQQHNAEVSDWCRRFSTWARANRLANRLPVDHDRGWVLGKHRGSYTWRGPYDSEISVDVLSLLIVTHRGKLVESVKDETKGEGINRKPNLGKYTIDDIKRHIAAHLATVRATIDPNACWPEK
jgi:hypothetical protein